MADLAASTIASGRSKCTAALPAQRTQLKLLLYPVPGLLVIDKDVVTAIVVLVDQKHSKQNRWMHRGESSGRIVALLADSRAGLSMYVGQ